MPAPCFHWHPDAHAFAGATEIIPQRGAAKASIPANPVAAAILELSKTLGSETGFCVSDFDVSELGQLNAGQFATLTGGTSGPPKVIARTQASWVQSFCANAALFRYTPADSIAVLGDLSHSLALYGVLEGLYLGHNVHALSPLPPSAQSTQLRDNRCTILYATPTQLRLLSAGTPLPDLRLVLCGGGTLSDAVRQHINAVFPNAALHVFYGAAESSFVTLSDVDTPSGSVGRTYPDVQIDVRDADDRGTGTIWVRSPYLFEGYLHGNSIHTLRDGDWLTVGEQGYLDDEGHLFLRGRSGRMINIADQSIFLDELEAQIATIPNMPPCVILPRRDDLRGHHLIAVIEGAENKSIRVTLLDHCKTNGLLAPREIVFLDKLPLLPSGKPDLQRTATLIGAPQ